MEDLDRPKDEGAVFSKFYLANLAGRPIFSFDSLELYKMSVELRQAIRFVYSKDASDRPAEYYL